MKKILLLFFCVFGYIGANENVLEVAKLIGKDLKQYEKLALSTKQNIHYQPYIISVLKNKDFTNLGITNLQEALELIPGVEFTSDNLNYKQAVFRGSNPVSFGQSKLYIDGVLVNNLYFDGYSEYLKMPIELIKRIEVIRGSGNKTKTTSSYAGAINVVTYMSEGSEKKGLYFAKYGSAGFKSIGYRKSYLVNNIKIYNDFFLEEDNEKVFTKSNGLKSGIFNFPGIDNSSLSKSSDVYLWYKVFSFSLGMKFENFYFLGRIYDYKQNPAFGLNYIQAREQDFLKTPNHFLQLGYKKHFKNLLVDTKFGLNINSAKANSKVVSDGVRLPKLSNPTQIVTFLDGMKSKNEAKQRTIYHESIFKLSSIKKHNIKFSYRISEDKTYEIKSKITNRDTGIGEVDYTDLLPFFDKDAKRKTLHISFDDLYNLDENLQFSFGLIYEKNTHIKAKLDPCVAFVYHEDNNIFKALYSKSHRTPSWQELYTINNYARVGNKELKAETIDSFEFSYIKQLSNTNFFSASIFQIINKNQIHNVSENNQYINSKQKNIINGLELEYKNNFSPKDIVYANFSYIDGDNSFDNKLVGVSNILLKGYLIHKISSNLSSSLVLKYNGPQNRNLYDKREKLKSTTKIDTSLIYQNPLKGYRFTFAIKNILNKNLVYASKPYTYEDDYPQSGRKIVISFSKDL